ncbi:MAG: IS3 family transposase [Planctomycetaceae bacterium]
MQWLLRVEEAVGGESSQRAESLTAEIEDIHLKRKQVYGSPRVHRELLDRGTTCA